MLHWQAEVELEASRKFMGSSITQLRAWIAALLVFVAIESAVALVGRPSPIDATNLLDFSFARPEPAQRLFVFHKLRTFQYSSPTIVQVGDSSGFYGIDPRAVMKYLPAGTSYLNMSCCANLGFRGYYNILEFIARYNPSVRYMVLHITPYTMPRPEMWGADGANLWGAPGLEVFGGVIQHEFLSPWRFLHPPSMAYRRQVTNFVYYLGPLVHRVGHLLRNNANTDVTGEPSVDILRAEVGSDPYFEFLRNYRQSYGWTPETDRPGGVYASECDIPVQDFFDYRTMSRKTYLEDVFDAFADLAKRHHSKLVIVFQPVACIVGTGKLNERARSIVEKFKQDHPEVEIPFPLIETWPADLFSVPAHISREHTDLLAERLGPVMAEIMKRNGR